jgi:hypothetical protein
MPNPFLAHALMARYDGTCPSVKDVETELIPFGHQHRLIFHEKR